MTRSFERVGDAIRMRLEHAEVDLLRSLHEGLVATLDASQPDDPVIERLFPSAVEGDTDADVELRRLLRDDLLERRRVALAALVGILDRAQRKRGAVVVDLVDDEPHLVLATLNDLRLAIGARVGFDELERARVGADERSAQRIGVMDHLGWLQEQLLMVVDPGSVSTHDEGDTA